MSLSNYIEPDDLKLYSKGGVGIIRNYPVLPVEKVKEFIKQLKEEFKKFDMVFKLNIVNDMIDKLAGDELIK